MKSFLPLLLSAALLPAAAQVAVNSDGSSPHASAMLEVTSTNSGVLIPRLSLAQRDAIPTPATGLMVYVTDDNLFHFYNGTAWMAISPGAGNPTDELQTLSRTGTDVTLSDSGGTVSISDNDNDAANELQTLSKSGNNLTLSKGGGTFSMADNDNDSTNELDSKWSTANGAIHHNDGEVGIGTNNPDTLFHVSSGTESAATGVKLTQDSANSLIYHNDGDLILRKFSEMNQLVLDAGGNVGIGTNGPSQALDINGRIRIRGGNPGAGKVLTASNDNGEAVWSSSTGPQMESTEGVGTNTINRGNGDRDGTTDWGNTSYSASIDNLSNGDRILVFVSFLMKLDGGGGTDETNFRIRANNYTAGNGVNQYSLPTGVITDLNRDNWVLYSFHRAMTITRGSGTYRFYLEVDENLTDDDIRFFNQEISAIKF